MRHLLAPLVAASLVVACGVTSGDSDSADEAISTRFGGIVPGSDQACAVLRVMNEASEVDLDRSVGIDKRAAAAALALRAGPDAKLGTDDDGWFAKLDDVDAIPQIGPAAFRKLKAFAAANAGYTCGKVAVQLLAFNDFHGNLKPPAGSSGRIATGPAPTDVVDVGGAEFFATHIKRLKSENPNTLIVAAGDIVGGTPLVSALFHDEPAIESMNALGLDVATVGNHEFDEGPDELLRLQNGGCHPVDGCQDGDGFAGAKFRYLSANVVRESTGKTLFPSYTVRSFRGARVAFIGVTLYIGGVRADIIAAQSAGGEAAGKITYGEAFTVQPFGNTLMTITLTGEQMKTMLEQQWRLVGGAEKAAILQVSDTFSYAWDPEKPIGSRVDPASMKIGGVPVAPQQSYRITVNAFLADGGDGFAVLKEGTNRVAGGLDLDALLKHLQERGSLAPPAATRITRR